MARGSLDDLAAFAAVARARSFTRAAATLRLSTSALSHTIKGLEAHLGMRLLQRNSRSVAVTEAGERLLQTLEPAFAAVDSVLAELGRDRDQLSGTVRLTATRHAFESVIRPVLPEFLAAHPRARVEVLVEYGLSDIIAKRLDAGIRIGEKLENDMIAVSVGPELCMAVVGSPAYLAAQGVPQTPQDLARHRCVNYRMMASGQTLEWEFAKDGQSLAVKAEGPLIFNDPELMIHAAQDGLGLAYILTEQAAPHIATGRLVQVLGDWMLPFPGYFLYYPSRQQTPPVLAALVTVLRRARQERTAAANRD